MKLSEPLYLGGVPLFESAHPPQLWSQEVTPGYVGCVRDLVINGVSVQLGDLARSQDLGSVVSGCQYHGDQCDQPSSAPAAAVLCHATLTALSTIINIGWCRP